MTDLNTCPRCGGPADNGHDRCYPPNPYVCTKCESKPPEPTSDAMPDYTPEEWLTYLKNIDGPIAAKSADIIGRLLDDLAYLDYCAVEGDAPDLGEQK